MHYLETGIGSEYRVHRYLGTGPLGYVYAVSRADEQGAHASYALKLLRDELLASDHDRRALKLAHDQAKEIASHSRIVPILDIKARNGHIWALNALDSGQSLESILLRAGAQGLQLQVRDVMTLMRAIVEGLDALHQLAMPHGDLKPSNIRAVNAYVEQGSYVRDIALSDYIYAHVITRSQCMRLQADAALYAAPEQFDGAVLLASDQYALAAILFRCLTGKTPFLPRSAESIILQKRDTTILQSRAPDLHPEALGVLQRALDSRPDARFPSVRAFSQALSAAVSAHEEQLFVPTVHAGGPPRIRRREMLMGAAATVAGFMVTGLLRAPVMQASLATIRTTGNATQPATATAYDRTWTTKAHSQATAALAWSSSGTRLLTGGADGTVRVWAPADSEQALMTIHATGPVNSVAWSPAGDLVAFADNSGLVRLANPLNGQITASMDMHSGAVNGVDWYPDGKSLVCGSASGHVIVWNVSTHEETLLPSGPKRPVNTVAVSRNGNFIAVGLVSSDLYIWNARTGVRLTTLSQSGGSLYAVAFSPDSQQVAAAGADTRVRIWKTDTFEVVTILPSEDTAPVRSLSWSSDGQMLVSGSEDGQLVLWNMGSATREHKSVSIGTPVLHVDWQAHTRTLAIAGKDGTAAIWNPRG